MCSVGVNGSSIRARVAVRVGFWVRVLNRHLYSVFVLFGGVVNVVM